MPTWLNLAAIVVASLGSALPLHAQTVVGTCQITIDGQRQVAKFTKARDGSLCDAYYDLGQDAAEKSLTASVRSGLRIDST
jgi:L-asparaginase/Glu-tRNA(Gln) amidotransferase subunit D